MKTLEQLKQEAQDAQVALQAAEQAAQQAEREAAEAERTARLKAAEQVARDAKIARMTNVLKAMNHVLPFTVDTFGNMTYRSDIFTCSVALEETYESVTSYRRRATGKYRLVVDVCNRANGYNHDVRRFPAKKDGSYSFDKACAFVLESHSGASAAQQRKEEKAREVNAASTRAAEVAVQSKHVKVFGTVTHSGYVQTAPEGKVFVSVPMVAVDAATAAKIVAAIREVMGE
jgi:galactitol-specific phosphotransferase system IIB component